MTGTAQNAPQDIKTVGGPQAAETVSAVINLDLPGPKISRHLYGHFAEHLGHCIYGGFFVGDGSDIPNDGGIRLDVVQALRDAGIPNLRWPGGCFADEYHWRDGIGPREQRPRMVNSHWGDVVEDNSFGTHEFMRLCELLGAEPYISANVGSGTVRESSDWVEYLTRADDSPMADLRRANGREEPWPLRFWGLGNEPWGCGGNMRAEAYADLARQFGTYARNHGTNQLYRIAAGAAEDDYRWTEVLMQGLGRQLRSRGAARHHGPAPYQALSFHYYTVPGPWEHKGSATDFDDEEYYRTIAQAQRIEEILAGHCSVMDAYDPDQRVGLVLDEWGTWFDTEPGTNPGFLYQQNTLRDALVAAVHFESFHRHADRLVMANIAQTVNVLQAMILTDGETMIRTPTYHVFAMNKRHHDALSIPVLLRSESPTAGSADRVPTFAASASVTQASGTLSLTNLDAHRAIAVDLDLRGRRVGEPTGEILTAESLNAHNTAGEPDAVAVRPFSGCRLEGSTLRVDLPPHAIVTIGLPLHS